MKKYQNILTWYHFPGVLAAAYNIVISSLPWVDNFFPVFAVPLEHIVQAAGIFCERRDRER